MYNLYFVTTVLLQLYMQILQSNIWPECNMDIIQLSCLVNQNNVAICIHDVVCINAQNLFTDQREL